MSNDPGPAGSVPDPVADWLSAVAEETGRSERELVARLLSDDGQGAFGESDADATGLSERIDALDASVEALNADVEAAGADVEAAEAEFDDKIQDVRERVIQVKRETDAKASPDHGHPELAAGVDRLGENLDALGRDFADYDVTLHRLDDRIEAVDDRLGRGFSNYEEVLSYLIEVTDDLEEKVESLAEVAHDLRPRAGRLASADDRRAAADRLRESAHVHGVTEAKCAGCGETVFLGLLAAAECPHCDATFADVEPRRGFFRSSVLHTGGQPALEGDVEDSDPALDRLASTTSEPPPSLDRRIPEAGRPGDRTLDDSDEPSAAETEGQKAGEETERQRAEEETEEPEADDAEPASSESVASDPADLAVDAVSGVGPAYAEQLGDAGVETVGDLASSDPERLAGRTNIAPGRLETLVSRARETVAGE